MRWIAGILLVGAAVLKTVELVTDSTVVATAPFGATFLAVQIGIEFTIGLVVLLGVYWRMLRWLVSVLFFFFAAYSFYLALGGAASCGCFGPVHINPWWTFIVDFTIFVGLLIASLRNDRVISLTLMPGSAIGWLSANRHKLSAGALAVGVIATTLLVRYVSHPAAVAEGITSTAGGLVVLEPEKWIGKTLPIAEFIDGNLSSGEWTAVLHRHDCPVCLGALPRYEELASTGKPVALIEVPPYGESLSTNSACLCCRLNDVREWFVQTPTEIQLRDGIVLSAKTIGH